MRRGTWILAISGMMALHQSGLAADPASGQSSNKAGNSTSGRTLKKASTTEYQPKNYYKDLFGDEDSAPAAAPKKYVPASAPPNTTPGDWADDPISEPAPPAKPSAKRPATKFDDASSEIQQTSNKVGAGSADKAKNSKVVQAVYDKPAGKKTPVQQVRSDGRPRSAPPAAPTTPSFDDAPEAPVRSGARKEHRVGIVHEEHAPAPAPAAPQEPAASAQSEPQTSQVTVEWMKRGEFNVGQECLVDLVVKNSGSTAVSQLAIDAFFPTNVRLTAAEPRPASATDRLTWNIDQLAPGGEQKITVKLIPSRRGEIAANAQVRYTGASTASFAIHEPMLKVSVKSPSKEVMLGDPTSQMITVTNPGTGTAHEVKIEAKLSEGLEHPTREDHLVIDVGSVGPGETRTYRLGLTASKGGPQSVSVAATSSCDASSSDSVEFSVIAPSLKIAVDGPSLRYKGRNAKYTCTVTNDGSLGNNNVHISQIVADGFKFVSADHQGKYDASTKTVHWYIGRLEPGENAQVACELSSQQIGEFSQAVQVASDSGVRADAKIDTRVDGIASLTMELADLDDPVETGAETAYEIRVKNDGSKAATAVNIACELPAGMELLSAKSPVDRMVEGRLLTFKPIDSIAPGEQVTLKVHMKVIREGSHRLRVRLTGGGLPEPMLLEEVTRAYSDGSN